MSMATAQTQTPENLGILEQAHEAVSAEQRVADSYVEVSQENGGNQFGRKLAIGLAAAAITLGGAAKEADTASASSGSKTELTSIQTDVLTQVGSKSYSNDSEISKGKVTFLSYVRAKGLPKRYVNKRNCYWDRNGGYNSGAKINSPTRPRRVQDVGWFKDSRDTYVCRVPKSLSPTGLAKAKCGNFWKDRAPRVRLIKTPVVMVRNWANANVKVVAKSKAVASAQCRTPDGSSASLAFGSGSGYASGRVNLRALLKARGRGETVSRLNGEAYGEAKSSSFAKAEAFCASVSVPGKPNVPPTNPPEKKNLPPAVNLDGKQHVLFGGEVEFRAFGSDPDGQSDIAGRVFSESGKGEFISSIRPGSEEGEFRIDYKAGTEAEQASVTATVIDKANNSASDTETFPVVTNAGEF